MNNAIAAFSEDVQQRAMRNFQIHELDGMDIVADKKEVLAKLAANLERHAAIVVEAREGYIKKASEALAERLEKLKAGKLVSTNFDLSPPQDYSDIYKVAIQMLQMDTSSTVKLTPQQFSHLMLDQWDWSTGFLLANAAYSRTAAATLNG